MIDRSQTRDIPSRPMALETDQLLGTRVAEAILASSYMQLHTKAGHMDASDPIKPNIHSCKQGAVHISGGGLLPSPFSFVPRAWNVEDALLKTLRTA